MTAETETLTLAEIEALALAALSNSGASATQATPLAHATAETEAAGIASHGLAYVPTYCEHVTCGKVIGTATPALDRPRPGVIRVDAGNGFAHAAIAAGFTPACDAARTQGIALLSIHNSYNCGVLGIHTTAFAEAGLLALGFTNAPASIAPSGGAKPVIGTNPISMAVPDSAGGLAFLIDQSASVIAKSEVMKHAREGRPIPEGWTLGPDGKPTTDPETGLAGSMVPAGGYKGVGIGLIVEVLAAALSGATLGKDASPFSGTKGGPPATGQGFIVIDPAAPSGGAFADRINALVAAMRDQPGVHIPGDRRLAARTRAAIDGVAVSAATLARVRALT